MFHSFHWLRWTQQIGLLPINEWFFIAQLVEHGSAYTEAMGSDPIEDLNKHFFRLICILLLKML